jgi:DNA-binding NarL/FixJ family response regulator
VALQTQPDVATINHTGPILIVDDDPQFRELASAILSDAGYQPQVATTGKEALELADERRPAVVISDVLLPGPSGYELCRSLRQRFGESLPFILISGERTEPIDSVVAFLLGADDYLTKPFEIEELLARVHRFIARAAGSTAQEERRSPQDLTPREYEVLGLLSSGLSQRKIAQRLVISSKTVATHIQRILTKLEVHSRAEAVALAYRTGLLAPTRAGADSNGDGRGDRATMALGPALDSHLSSLANAGGVPDPAAKRSERAA